MIKFPSIGQFRAAVKNVRFHATYTGKEMEGGYPIYDRTLPSPALEYVGTPKLHGTNGSIVQLEKGGELNVQSRNREISVNNDNQRFAHFVKEREEFWSAYFDTTRSFLSVEPSTIVTVYGEWCGSGIQSGVGISGLDRMFVVFAIRFHEEDDTVWATPDQMRMIPSNETLSVRNIFDFQNYELTIDFEKPGLVQNTLVSLTDDVERECPVAKAMGIPNGVGEGIVWRCVTPGYESSRFWFKVKGKKHSVTKVRVLAPVDVEKVKSINEFVESVLTESRLNQGIEYLKEMNIELSSKGTGDYLRWIMYDINKEEGDTIKANEFTPKDINKRISNVARVWFFNWIKRNDEF